jgi:hypothetical protein
MGPGQNDGDSVLGVGAILHPSPNGRPLATALALVLLLAPARAALAQPMGDPTPGTLAPLVVIVTPMNGGVVGSTVRVEARVHHPSGLDAIASVSLSITDASPSSVALSRNASYALGPATGIYEAVVPLAAGGHTLVAIATDTGGRSTRSAAVSVAANEDRGDGYLLVRDNSSPLCTACHAILDHGSEAAGRAYGAWTTTCRDCHAPHGTRNVFLVRETIEPPWVAGAEPPQPKAVRVSRRAGFAAAGGVANRSEASFANGDGSGPCQACHTRTARWRGGGPADAIHLGDCAFCHRHQAGFRSRCEDCHPAPPATGAHAAHHGASSPSPPFPSDPRPLGCGSCHPTDPARHGDGVRQIALNTALRLPGGTSTAGAQATGSSTATSCSVACHFPLGAPAPADPVAWSAGGPLPCTACHSAINPGGAPPTPRAGPSLHDPIFSVARPPSGEPTTCFSCHASGSHDATHLTGDPALVATTAVDAACIACHTPPSGPGGGSAGQVLHRGSDAATSRTPPILPGWSTVTVDASAGDFHGGRRGTCFDPNLGPVACGAGVTPTGYGGTLVAPFTRGYPAMPCATCHAGHASENGFLLAATVNGRAIPPGAIDRTGVGAEALCEACHAGGRHDRCKECHTDAYVCDAGVCWMDPAANPVDPAPPGSACFFCHGHEGILRWTEPYSGRDMNGAWDTSCDHCHGFGMPATRLAPPALSLAPVVSAVSATGATITWQTDEPASSWVEYGVGQPGWVAGSAAEVQSHAVTLAGLTPATTYVWRVRSVDAFRNVLRTSIASFTTTAPGIPPYPDVVAVGWTGVPAPQTTMTLPLRWYAVAAPTGNRVEYRVQLASDPAFATLVDGSPPDSGWIPGTVETYGGRDARSFTVTLTGLPVDQCAGEAPFNQYYWRVKARDAVTGAESDWSAVDAFQATSYDPYGC